MTADTPQQAHVLRSAAGGPARWVRERYPAGTRVASVVSGQTGTVTRHVPGLNAQGGYLVIDWDNGHTGRTSAVNVRPA